MVLGPPKLSQVGFLEMGTGFQTLKAVDNPLVPSVDLELHLFFILYAYILGFVVLFEFVFHGLFLSTHKNAQDDISVAFIQHLFDFSKAPL